MRNRQQLGCLRIRDGAITLEKMYFANEIRPVDEITSRSARVSKQELELAGDLIDRFAGSFDPGKYEDTYRASLLKVIEQKRAGQEIHVEARPKDERPTDLLAALRASVEQHTRKGGSSRGGTNGLGALSKSELEERARKAKIAGRSRMTKEQLVEALDAA